MKVGYLLFDEMTQLDLTGPLQVLSRVPGAVSFIVAETPESVRTDCELMLPPTVTFDRCPDLDALLIPGGRGVAGVISNPAAMSFVTHQASVAQWLVSVCTGAFVLGAAGLLTGRKATTHWGYHDLLPLVGAIPVSARYVADGAIYTSAGVTAGIDLGFQLAEIMVGDIEAERIRLALEYDVSPRDSLPGPSRNRSASLRRLQDSYAEHRGNLTRALEIAKGL